ncbi:tissue factor pathway inhibitor-like [Bicyclus anynana]|uniref:Tissue factor pathway inhibitor-like n=1 Tax=Bicyclus anynana TaxID=110368 RepID=A0ABM3M523_BICAN|nr:tissue factor pathway inhibitor-like [Bicyclus anynana]
MLSSCFLGYVFVLPIIHTVICYGIKNESSELNITTTPTTPESFHFIKLDTTVTCKFQPNGYDCHGTGQFRPKYFYDLQLQDCKSYTIGSCPFNLNAYNTLSECHNTCRDYGTHPAPTDLKPRIFCRFQQDFGHCNGYNPRWYFDMTSRRCRGFSYSGCGGNLNRFDTQQDCVSVCTGATEHKLDLN